MVKDNEISSTEKLLAMIRDENSEKPEPAAAPVPSIPAAGKRPLSIQASSPQSINIGLYFSNERLLLVKVDSSSDEAPRLLDYAEVVLETGITADSQRFAAFIKSLLNNYCGSLKQVNVWAVISSASTETRRLLIPRVPKKQIFNAVYWSYKKNVSLNDNKDIFDFEILGNITDEGVKKIEVTAYSSPKKVVTELQSLFDEAGYPLTGISSLPFAVQNMFRSGWYACSGNSSICTIYIDQEWSYINIYSNHNLVLSRVIKSGIQSMQESLRDMLASRELDGTASTSGENGLPADTGSGKQELAAIVLSDFIEGRISPETGVKTIDLNKGDIFRAILPALDRLVKQLERTLKHFYLNFGNQRVKKILISGLINGNTRIAEYIGAQLEINVEIFNPFPEKALPEDKIPASFKSGGMLPAAGIALANNKITPNFIFTYRDKAKSTLAKQINFSLFAFLIFLMAVCVGVYVSRDHVLSQKQSLLSALNRELEGYIPNVDRKLLLEMAARAKASRSELDNMSSRHLGLALIGELTDLTPASIRLLSVKSKLNGSHTAGKNTLDIEGVVFGDRLTFETMLGAYLVKLKKSLLFDKPVVKKNLIETWEGKEVCRFSVSLDLLTIKQ